MDKYIDKDGNPIQEGFYYEKFYIRSIDNEESHETVEMNLVYLYKGGDTWMKERSKNSKEKLNPQLFLSL